MKLILFDIDGTILTSKGSGRSAVQEALQLIAGVTVNTHSVSFAGRTDPAIMKDLLRGSGVSEVRINELFDRCLEAYVGVLMRNLEPSMVTLLPGIHALVQSLHARSDVALGLLTGNLRDTAFLKLHAVGLGSYFQFGAFGSDHEYRNELPRIARDRAAQTLGYAIRPEKTVIVGDTPNDIACAVTDGARSIAVCTGVFSRAELAVHNADLLLDDFSDPEPVNVFLGGI